MRPRIVIVDDDPSFLATVRLLLEAEGFAVVGEALNGLDGMAAVLELDPDIVLVDVNLPDIDGFEVVERLAQEESAPPVVLTSIRSAHGSKAGSTGSTTPRQSSQSFGVVDGGSSTICIWPQATSIMSLSDQVA